MIKTKSEKTKSEKTTYTSKLNSKNVIYTITKTNEKVPYPIHVNIPSFLGNFNDLEKLHDFIKQTINDIQLGK